MLYPDFDDLVALKDFKLDLLQKSSSASHASALGGQRSPFRGQGIEFDSVRKYVVGDDIRNIDWRVTARTNSPHLKIFKEDRERQILLCVDMNATMRFGTKKTFKSVQAAQIAALLGWRGMANQDKISACLFGDVPGGIELFSPARTKSAFSSLLKRMSEIPAEKHYVSLGDAIGNLIVSMRNGSLVYVISDFMEMTSDPKQDVNLSRLTKHCDVVFIAVNDRADRELIPVGNLGFCNANQEKIYVNTNNAAGRKAYEQLWQKNREQLQEMVKRFKIPLIELTTESDIPRDLSLGLNRLARRKNR